MTDTKNYPVWPGWETVRLIGRGSFGAVYEIQRDVFGHKEKAALKVITIPQNESDIEDLLSDGYDEASITTRFEGYLHDIVKEYSMMADMKGCANIVYCDDVRYIQHDNGIGWDIFIKMELLTALPKIVEKTVPDKQVVKIGMDICSALAFCEKRNILHRDIKPQNIFVAPDGTYKLGDFGIAKTAERTTRGTKTGTYKYMAPEVYNNQPYGRKADIYSLGLVLYWLLNGRRTPFLPLTVPTSAEEDKARARRFSGEALPAPKNGSEELKRIVLKACAYDVNDRYHSADEMLEDLNTLQEIKVNSVVIPVKQVTDDRPADEPDTAEGTMGVWGKQKTPLTVSDDKTAGAFPEKLPVSSEKTMLGQERPKRPWMVILTACAVVCLVIGVMFFMGRNSAPKEDMQNASAPISSAQETIAPNQQVSPSGVKIGDHVTFGRYPQTAEGTDLTPIEWQVLDIQNDNALIISKNVLDSNHYNDIAQDVTWETCTVRAWLNNEFLQNAFSDWERGQIAEKTVNNSAAECRDGSVRESNNTIDKLFFLSWREAEIYFQSDKARMATATPFAISQGVFFENPFYPDIDTRNDSLYQQTCGDGNYASWWLRNVAPLPEEGWEDYYPVWEIRFDGTTYSQSLVNMNMGIRPAMWINLNALETAVEPQPEELQIIPNWCFDGDVTVKGRQICFSCSDALWWADGTPVKFLQVYTYDDQGQACDYREFQIFQTVEAAQEAYSDCLAYSHDGRNWLGIAKNDNSCHYSYNDKTVVIVYNETYFRESAFATFASAIDTWAGYGWTVRYV